MFVKKTSQPRIEQENGTLTFWTTGMPAFPRALPLAEMGPGYTKYVDMKNVHRIL